MSYWGLEQYARFELTELQKKEKELVRKQQMEIKLKNLEHQIKELGLRPLESDFFNATIYYWDPSEFKMYSSQLCDPLVEVPQSSTEFADIANYNNLITN
mgnify:CR=1 FL=1